MTWWVVVNPAAGTREPWEARVRRCLQELGLDAVVGVSSSAAHLRELVAAGVAAGARRFVAVGGDGTVSLTADALLGHPWEQPPTLGILPAGSGCDFVRTFGIPQQLEAAARHLTGEGTCPIDVGVAEGAWGRRRFLNVLDIGVIAATVRTAERATRRLGRFRYKAAFWATLPLFRTTRLTIELERRTFEGRANTVVVANGQYFGFNMNVAPRASPSDGLLDVQVFTGPKTSALVLLPKVSRGRHLAHPLVTRFRSATVEVTTAHPWPIEVDGDYLGETPVRVGLEPGALRLKV
ncbi:MAG: diacylglycerol kinase family lipid kinase [Actinobacteria bacterium]|nr:diacylglycerol kinase family lipid kinase [Actinomycetota bacterium]